MESRMATRLYVKNIPFRITKEDFIGIFKDKGEVVSARIIFEKTTGRSKGFGFVEMAKEEEVQRVLNEINGMEVNGRILTIEVALPPKEGDY